MSSYHHQPVSQSLYRARSTGRLNYPRSSDPGSYVPQAHHRHHHQYSTPISGSRLHPSSASYGVGSAGSYGSRNVAGTGGRTHHNNNPSSTGFLNPRYKTYGGSSQDLSSLSSPSSGSYERRSKPVDRTYTTNFNRDYKKLYEDERNEKESIRKRLDQIQSDLNKAKQEVDKLRKSGGSNSLEKKERKSMERKIAEQDDILKVEFDHLKNDNKKLKEENGALIRVISKLSK